MQKRSLISLAVFLLLVSIIIGGCTTMSDKPIAKPITDNKFPEKPITMIVPYSAGGGTDLIARVMEKESVKYLGQPLVVVNKPGATGNIGWNELASSSPDGYTLGMTVIDLILQPSYGNTKYHYITALRPLIQIATTPLIMVIKTEQPWQNVHQLIEYSRENPGQLKFAHGGIGSMPHVVGETFAKVADSNIAQVPFRGASDSITALLGNHVEIVFVPSASVKEQIKSGTVRALAVASEHRLTDPYLAHIPTFKEQGFDIVFNNWYGVAAPKDLPPEAETKLAEGFKAMISDPEFKSSMNILGAEMEYLGPNETQNQWIVDNEKLTKIIQETGILDKIKAQKN